MALVDNIADEVIKIETLRFSGEVFSQSVRMDTISLFIVQRSIRLPKQLKNVKISDFTYYFFK